MTKEKDFSIMIPTRKRVEMLKHLIRSVIDNTFNLDSVEIILMIDNDDTETIQAMPSIKETFSHLITLKVIRKARSFNISDYYYNSMALEASEGKYLIAVNDDAHFINKDWDRLALAKISSYLQDKPDDIFYGITEDREIEVKRDASYWFSCFPLISKKAVDALGFFFDPDYIKDGADWDIFGLYKDVNRVLDLRVEIIIEHISVRSGRREKDALDRDVLRMQQVKPPLPGKNRDSLLVFLKNYIDTYQSHKGVNQRTWLAINKPR